jgi:hypothetical protein
LTELCQLASPVMCARTRFKADQACLAPGLRTL